MKPNSKSVDRKALLRLARGVRARLIESVHDPSLVPEPNPIGLWETDTYGYYVRVAKIRGVAGELQVWCDHFARASDGPKVSACFMSGETDRISAIAKAGVASLGKARVLGDDEWSSTSDGGTQRLHPLPRKLYRRPLSELYERQGSKKFYTMYWPGPIKEFDRRKLVDEVGMFLIRTARAILGLRDARGTDDYPGVENRTRVARHLIRERNAAQARQARTRDHFTCKVCGINFADLYGTLGRGFAEVHHIVPLAAPRAPKVTRVEDLVTVCANCHRMLHRMKGNSSDVRRLQKLFTARWPKPQV